MSIGARRMATWNPRANEIFLAAADIASAQERARYLDQACAGDAELRRDVEMLLSAGERAAQSRFLESQAGSVPSPTVSAKTIPTGTFEGPGTIIGNYKLLDRIGEGGFGVVFMADQVRPVQRRVAVKIIKPGM